MSEVIIHDYPAIVRTDGKGKVLYIFSKKPCMKWVSTNKVAVVPEDYGLLVNDMKACERDD